MSKVNIDKDLYVSYKQIYNMRGILQQLMELKENDLSQKAVLFEKLKQAEKERMQALYSLKTNKHLLFEQNNVMTKNTVNHQYALYLAWGNQKRMDDFIKNDFYLENSQNLFYSTTSPPKDLLLQYLKQSIKKSMQNGYYSSFHNINPEKNPNESKLALFNRQIKNLPYFACVQKPIGKNLAFVYYIINMESGIVLRFEFEKQEGYYHICKNINFLHILEGELFVIPSYIDWFYPDPKYSEQQKTDVQMQITDRLNEQFGHQINLGREDISEFQLQRQMKQSMLGYIRQVKIMNHEKGLTIHRLQTKVAFQMLEEYLNHPCYRCRKYLLWAQSDKKFYYPNIYFIMPQNDIRVSQYVAQVNSKYKSDDSIKQMIKDSFFPHYYYHEECMAKEVHERKINFTQKTMVRHN